jgi:hypothetical protein
MPEQFPPLEVLPAEFLEYWLGVNEVDVEHAVQHVSATTLDQPGLVLRFGPESIPPKHRAFFEKLSPFPQATILIDGVHRASRALRDGQPFWVYPLTAQEQQVCFLGARIG